jgi:quercetin dioxygenase-like cupin family protein
MKRMPITSSNKWVKVIAILPCVAMSFSGAGIAPASSKPSRGKTILSRSLPRLDGANLKVTVVEVTYGPGESSAPHSHPCPVIGYVVEGTLRSKVNGETEATYKVGESFYEAPNGIHAISANASASDPAKFLAFFVCDHDTLLSAPVPTTGAQPETNHE